MKGSRYAWVVVATLWLVFLLNYLDRQVIFSLFPLLQRDLRLLDFQLGLIPMAFLWVYALCSPLGGFLADRFGRKRIIILSLMIWSLMSAAIGEARSFPQLLVAVALMGISEACYLPAGLALIADYHGERSRSLATGIHQSGSYAGMVLGGLGGGWIGEHYGWRAAFMLLGAIGVIYGLFVMLVLREKAERQSAVAASGTISLLPAIRNLLNLPGFLTLTLVFSAMGMANWVLYTWMPLYLYERFHMSLSRAGFSATFYLQIGSVAGILLGGWLADHFSSRTPRSRLLTQAGGLMAAAPFLLFVGMASSSVLLLLALVAFGVGRGAYDANCMPVLCQIAPSGLRSTGYGLFNFASCVAGGLVTAAAGALKSTLGLGVTIQVTGILLLGSALLLLRVRVVPSVARDAF
jgi:MFS family permease